MKYRMALSPMLHKAISIAATTKTVVCLLLIHSMYMGPASSSLQAQWLDSAKIQLGTLVSVASQGYQPHWLVSQRWGTISDRQFDAATHAAFHNTHTLGNSPIQQYGWKLKKRPVPAVSYGFSVYNNQHVQQTRLQEGYIKLNYGHWQLAAGRYQEVIGEVPDQLSSGSLGISGNAVPIPKVSIGLSDYTDIPFVAPGWVQVKGQVSVGLMEKEAYVDNARFHHRSLYFQVGKKDVVDWRSRVTLSLFGGLNQFAIWGGEHPSEGKLPNSMLNLTKIIVPGNNLGFFDYGFTLLKQGIKIKGYTQVPFEGRGSVNPFRIKDRMVGLLVSDTRRGSFFPDIMLEAINTTWQDPDPEKTTSQVDYNFYNNRIYADGWSYHGRILGTPLFANKQRATHYFGENFNTNLGYDWNIVNNRINGIHVGVKGQVPSRKLYYRTLATFTINHGNYYVPGLFKDRSNKQLYFMQELAYHYEALEFTGSLGLDLGGMTRNVGALLGIAYNVHYHLQAPKIPTPRRRSYRRRRRW